MGAGIQLQVLSANTCIWSACAILSGTSTCALFCEYVLSSQPFGIPWLGEISRYINVQVHAMSLHRYPKHCPRPLDSSLEFMPPQRPAARIRSFRNSRSLTANHRQRSPAPVSISIPESVFTANPESTPIASREVSTEPATPVPSSPIATPATGTNRRPLRRERSARFLHAVLHYSRAEDDLEPWFWCVYIFVPLISPLDRFSPVLFPCAHSFLSGRSTTRGNGLPRLVFSNTDFHMISKALAVCARP
jgi:hypothetical protein